MVGGSLNLFSQVGIIMLIGLAAKNGILIVEFANQRRDAGLGVDAAIIEAASVRLRPILMTSIATAAGALPLMLGSGPGSGSRQAIGIVVVFGVLCATVADVIHCAGHVPLACAVYAVSGAARPRFEQARSRDAGCRRRDALMRRE